VESLENSKDEFPTLSTGLGNPAHNAGFPHFHRAGGGFNLEGRRREDEEKTQFPLTDLDHFRQDKKASVAALRK